MIRNEYRFARVLSDDEATLLAELIAWRKGSRLIEDQSGIVGVIAHPDDVAAFEKELRTRGIRLKVTLVAAEPDAGTVRKWGAIKDSDIPF